MVLLFVFVVSAEARAAKDLYEGKTAGNSGFTNFVGDNFKDDVTGWVRYGKKGNAFQTTWHVEGLVPGAEYQLKFLTCASF